MVRARLVVIVATAVVALLGQGCLSAASAAGLPLPTVTSSPSVTAGAEPPATDPFYRYTGATPLADIAPGTVLKTRKTTVHLEGLPLPLTTVQLLYRTSSELGNPITTVASVILPLAGTGTPKLISYQSAYDSLTPNCEPSYALAGGFDRGGIATGETAAMASYVLQGDTVVTADFEGQHPAFAAGHQYGRATLDGIRAALRSPATGLAEGAKVGMVGYSGGAIATEWATELAPKYAPDVNRRLVGSAIGGVFVDPIHNLHYVDGSPAWSGVMPMALIGIARAFHIDLTKYASAYGKSLLRKLQHACILDAYAHYPGLTFAKMVKPQYANPESIPALRRVVNELIMGTGGTPTTPMFIRQATGGQLEGTPGNKAGIGAGDGVMIAGDVRSLAREYCARGVGIDYGQYPLLSHIPAIAPFLAEADLWLAKRLNGGDSADNCSQIKPGNSIAPIS